MREKQIQTAKIAIKSVQLAPHPSKIKDFCHLLPGEGFGAVQI